MNTPIKQARKTCRRKKAFETRFDADVQITKDWFNNKITGLTPYKCTVCGKYHNGRLK